MDAFTDFMISIFLVLAVLILLVASVTSQTAWGRLVACGLCLAIASAGLFFSNTL